MSKFVKIGDASDRVMTALIADLEIEFGGGIDKALAQHFIDAEEIDFYWDARVLERWLGAYESLDDAETMLDRVAIYGRLDGYWFAATCNIDGDGNPHNIAGCRTFHSEAGAQKAYENAG